MSKNKPDNTHHGRFQDLEWYTGKFEDIIVGGAGGIGSWLIFFLSRIGHRLYIFDFDSVDRTNMAGQLYPTSCINMKKTQAMAELAKDFSNHKDILQYDKYEEDSLSGPIMMTCFDNMAGRKAMFDNWKIQDDKEVFLDGRMRAEYFEIYCVTPDKIKDYEATLFDDSEVPDLPCSAKATSHCGAMVGAMMVSMFNNWITNRDTPDTRIVPFKISMDLVLFMNEVVEEPEYNNPIIVDN